MPIIDRESSVSDREAIASGVRAELARQKIQQATVAGWIGVQRQSINYRLTGRMPFRAEELAIIARHLGVPVSRFYAPERAA